MAAARALVRDFVSLLEDYAHPDFSLRVWPTHLTQSAATVRIGSQAISDYVLLLDETGLTTISEDSRTMLLNPPPLQLPLGPRGMHNTACITATSTTQPATYLLPPFVLPRRLLLADSPIFDADSWFGLGNHVASQTEHSYGGIVLALDGEYDSAWCSQICHHDLTSSNTTSGDALFSSSHSFLMSNDPLFVILLPRLADLQAFVSVPCTLQDRGFTIFAALYAPTAVHPDRQLTYGSCVLEYIILSDPSSYLPYIRRAHGKDPDVVVALDELRFSTPGIPWIALPRRDLAYAGWMGRLSLRDYHNWHQPRVDISIITKDRPHSLSRLLDSLARARFFGDTLNVRVNMEQSADEETMKIVRDFRWPHGQIFLHHRVIHGGLLPAVVESWYPADDDTYGLLLEDDVELSPLFYAWIKMTLLHYRYSPTDDAISSMYGISLYQQKTVELHLSGRQPFSADELFSKNGFEYSSPYLSQIPCSWGAVYFPEHWRAFHAYLTLRFSQASMPIGNHVVPSIRSNRWTKSWKKYFIEMVYLRGLVMLYPNFAGYKSFSTNHLEVGAHVKQPDQERKAAFDLPLMGLEDVGLLSRAELPEWDDLPVLNLTGFMSSLEDLGRIGAGRREELARCGDEQAFGDDEQHVLRVCTE
ncbi:hypothetical protein CYLTODRAFT_392250 [Cylindrobasidium torrendii FP15055 ss-10]|uniref:Glycosyltransferase family 2 protein n=1 Tax=Cylindrobasidium torrendii FP15055 ss-10 TaxID=1314674 RepID=A0A0D7BJL1_9AGAR|nr:hypothetical protein CYLTODRAFT_392250 [Cylindrobasidium torrendii FP15055 ss-10]